jgi:phosphatidylserine/phosphatidylglycerophosphate/cardiolipin synthase-like enzyme
MDPYIKRAESRIQTDRDSFNRGNYDTILTNRETPVNRNKITNGSCRFVSQWPVNKEEHDFDFETKFVLSKVFIEYIQESIDMINLTTGSIDFNIDAPLVPTLTDGEDGKANYNYRFFNALFAKTGAPGSTLQVDIIGNGIDGGYGEASNMINRAKRKNGDKFKPARKFLQKFISKSLDKMAASSNQPFLENLSAVRPNIRAWSNFQYMHSKLLQFDRIVSVVSSYNLEGWSANGSHEVAIICTDPSLNDEMDRTLIQDFANSVPAGIVEP